MFTKLYEEKYMRFPGGKCKAAAFSYDDGVEADLKLIKIFDKYGVKGTFNLNNLLFDCHEWNGHMNEEQTYSAFKNSAHEVAIHGARHIFLDKVPLAEAAYEIMQNRAYLEKKFNKIVRGMAYAYNAYNDEIADLISRLGVQYARTTEGSLSFGIPKDFLRLKPTCHHNAPEFKELSEKFFNDSPLNITKHRESWLFFVWGHSYEFDNDAKWNIIENLCQKLGASGDIWLATCGEIISYIQAYNGLIFSVDGERVHNPSFTPVFMELRGEVYEIKGGQTINFKGV